MTLPYDIFRSIIMQPFYFDQQQKEDKKICPIFMHLAIH